MKRSALTVRRSQYHLLGLAVVLHVLLSACGGGESESTNDLSSAEQGQASGGITDFSYTGADQSFTVPEGVTELVLDLWGAGGEMASADLGGADCEYMPGGGGGYVNARIPVTPGEVLTVRVGGAPANRTGAGWPNGGNGWLDQVRMGRKVYTFGVYGGGGGSSSILRGDTVLVEAGGGNGGLPCTAPVGAGLAGTCSPSGNQRGMDHVSTGGSAGGGGWCGGGPDTPAASGAAPGIPWVLEAASGQSPGASTHPSRQGSGEGGFTAPATDGRVYLSWTSQVATEITIGHPEDWGGILSGDGMLASSVMVTAPVTVHHLGLVTRNTVAVRMAIYRDGLNGLVVGTGFATPPVAGRFELPVTETELAPGRYWIVHDFASRDGGVAWAAFGPEVQLFVNYTAELQPWPVPFSPTGGSFYGPQPAVYMLATQP